MAKRFETTRWSLVLAVQGGATPESREALGALCEAYWQPLHAHVRRRVRDDEQAQDLTQAFFADLLAREAFASVQPEAGRLRSYLLACLNHFLANEWERLRAHKRGGGRVVSLDARLEEGGESQEPAHDVTPEQLFDREWALTLLEQAKRALRSEWEAAGKTELLDALAPLLTGEGGGQPYRAIGEALGMSEGAVKVAVHRLRRRFGALLREAIAETVADPEAVDAELRHLLSALAHPDSPTPTSSPA